MSDNTSLIPPPSATAAASRVNRRILLGGVTGIAAVSLAGAGLVKAQTATTTPDAGESATRITALGERIASGIAAVEADRDAVADEIDLTMVDQLLVFATDLHGRLQEKAVTTPASSGTREKEAGTLRFLAAAGLTAGAARQEIVAELSVFGLPSQQAIVSRSLAETFADISDSGSTTAATTATPPAVHDADASSALDFAQQCYAAAYASYESGRYAQAIRHDLAAQRLVQVTHVLSGKLSVTRGKLEKMSVTDEVDGDALTRRERRKLRRTREERDTEMPNEDERGTPVAVPAPSFPANG